MKKTNILFLLLLVSFSAMANTVPTGMVYHGRVIKPNGFPLEDASVDFTITYYDPAKTCILREESFNIDMAHSDGVFTLSLGTGALTINDPANLFSDVFRNDLASLTCGTGGPGTISMSAGDTQRHSINR